MYFESSSVIKRALAAAFSSIIIMVLLLASYFIVEPRVGRAADTDSTFTVRQLIGAETSFLVPATNVAMDGTINGLTGGNATGTTQVVVRTNGADGYNMTIIFADENGDGVVMEGETNDSGAIQNYRATTTEPTFGFFFASSSAVFAYTVTASSSNLGDLDQSFQNDGATCNAVGFTNPDVCWMAPRTSAFTVVDRDNSAPLGATTTIKFRVYVPNNPLPSVDTDYYTATATLTVTTNI